MIGPFCSLSECFGVGWSSLGGVGRCKGVGYDMQHAICLVICILFLTCIKVADKQRPSLDEKRIFFLSAQAS